MKLDETTTRVLTEIGVLPKPETVPAWCKPAFRPVNRWRHYGEMLSHTTKDPVPLPLHPVQAAEGIAVRTPEGGFRSPGEILRDVCEVYDIDLDVLCSGRRSWEVSAARMVASAVLRRRGMSLPEIGDALGTNHSTVVSALKRYSGLTLAA